MYKLIENHITQNLPFLKESKTLIAISGGVDSVVLAYLSHKLNLNIALAHCNFNLRGKESDADEDFVFKLAEELNLEVFVEHFDTEKYAKESKQSIQMAARELRYNWFDELAKQLQFDYILTGHHADDNLETFLINLTRGTGLEGLTGIPEVNNKFVRPLLPFSREQIETFAKDNVISWRNDSSNASTKYLRNKLRHDVIPILKEINPNLLQSFQNTLNNLSDTADIIEESTATVLKQAIETKDSESIAYKISEFKKLKNPKAYLFEAFKTYGFTEWDDVANLLDAQSGKQVFSRTHRLIKDRSHFLLSKIPPEIIEGDIKQDVSILENDDKVEIPLGTLFLEEVEAVLDKSPNTIYVDKELLKYPLILRKKTEGDIFYPLGMKGKKKLSKYFKDEKLSLLDKENTWLLCSGDAIVWVVNRRADNRYRVTEKTKNILKIKLD
ncbi:tRNA lysidine(34) synthetase TilS [Flavivirga aquatica]|uniref:tRNA(Ile)-lysidine synthase n=1 Tax=Flavivirga aquatica TaxID=1849968 RepID=A0A1E5T9T1_9FLAO|nr:tRNA lysidine(34) synthetase TilS [Flavivirga aquatica]OEK08129.1 tRNA lysidine(34) synthetase TilS [Flavivirga aquatica]